MGFSTTESGKTHNINRQVALGGQMAGKGRSVLKKVFTVMGLNSPIMKNAYPAKSLMRQKLLTFSTPTYLSKVNNSTKLRK